MRSDIVPGATFPDYELPDHTKVPRKLSELQGDDPLILTLARGLYCPKEHQQHLELAANYPKVAVAYTQMATIATDGDHELKEFRASIGAQWTLLAGPQRAGPARGLGGGRPRALPRLGRAGRGHRLTAAALQRRRRIAFRSCSRMSSARRINSSTSSCSACR